MVKRFGAERGLDGVDLSVPRGAITVLLGPSGAGKTVTINHMVGLIEPIRRDRQGRGQGSGDGLRHGVERAAARNGRRRTRETQPFTCGLFFR